MERGARIHSLGAAPRGFGLAALDFFCESGQNRITTVAVMDGEMSPGQQGGDLLGDLGQDGREVRRKLSRADHALPFFQVCFQPPGFGEAVAVERAEPEWLVAIVVQRTQQRDFLRTSQEILHHVQPRHLADTAPRAQGRSIHSQRT